MPRRISKVLMTLLLVVGVLIPTAGAGYAAPQAAVAEPQLAASAASTEPYFFEETGHYLSGRFRQHWEDRGGLYVFGFPRTKVFRETSTDGEEYLTQYFERARFEYHPEKQAPFDVELTQLGREITENRRTEAAFLPAADMDYGLPPAEAADGAPCEGYFEPTQHNVQGVFCAFWDRYGGLTDFGYGLSEEFVEPSPTNGQPYTVQYFERGRWELHTENPAGSGFEVLLGLLGLERMERVGVPQAFRDRETSPPTAAEIPGGAGNAGTPPPPVAPPPPSVTFPLRTDSLQYGFNTFMIGNPGGASYNQRTLAKVNEANFGWVRIQMVWADIEPSPGDYRWEILDTQINAASAAGVQVLLSIVKSPAWISREVEGGLPETPGELDAFYNTVRMTSGRFKGKVKAYEIWNEQNLAGEVGGNVEVAPYVAVLKNGFDGVKKNDRGAFVLFGGLTPTAVNNPGLAIDDVSYLREVYAFNGGEVKQYFDALAAHPGSASNAPDVRFGDGSATGECPPAAFDRYGPQPDGCYNASPDFFFRRIEEQRAVMEQNGDAGKQVWLTEFGWASCENLPVPNGYEYCQLISEQEQARYIVRAFEIGRTDWGNWMGAMFVWNLNYQTIPNIPASDEKYSWAVLGPNFEARPAYDLIKGMQR